jgi:hypothetical protein
MEQAPHFRSLPTPRFPSDLSNIIDVRRPRIQYLQFGLSS